MRHRGPGKTGLGKGTCYPYITTQKKTTTPPLHTIATPSISPLRGRGKRKNKTKSRIKPVQTPATPLSRSMRNLHKTAAPLNPLLTWRGKEPPCVHRHRTLLPADAEGTPDFCLRRRRSRRPRHTAEGNTPQNGREVDEGKANGRSKGNGKVRVG